MGRPDPALKVTLGSHTNESNHGIMCTFHNCESSDWSAYGYVLLVRILCPSSIHAIHVSELICILLPRRRVFVSPPCFPLQPCPTGTWGRVQVLDDVWGVRLLFARWRVFTPNGSRVFASSPYAAFNHAHWLLGPWSGLS